MRRFRAVALLLGVLAPGGVQSDDGPRRPNPMIQLDLGMNASGGNQALSLHIDNVTIDAQ